MFQLHKSCISCSVEKTQVQVMSSQYIVVLMRNTLARQQMCSGDHKMANHCRILISYLL